MPEQADEKRLRELVERWQQLQAQGVEPSAAELCKDAPELLGPLQSRIRGLKPTDLYAKPAVQRVAADSGRPEDTLAPRPASRGTEGKTAVIPAPTIEAFVAQLSSSGLMSAAEVEAFRAGLPADKQPADATALARELVQQGKLTRYQATAVFQNKMRGLVFGDYVVLDRIGAGGMGQVYKAHHKRMDRIVALKVLPTAFSKNPDSVKRFQREVKAAARLNHSHIVTAYDAGEQDGMHYLVMEYVEGSDLSSVVKSGGPMPVKQAVDCVVQAARGLEHAHAEGIIHRDVKPSNLLLDKRGTVKILDLGLARVDSPLGAAADDGLTNTGNIMGTIDFMAPEQALDTKHADQRADIYGLGCTLYFLLSGRKMYEQDTVMKKLLGHREGAIPSLLAARPEVPAQLDAVYQKMVAKRPADRFQSMNEVRVALEASQVGAAPLLKGTVIRKPAPQPVATRPADALLEGDFRKRRSAARQSPRRLVWGGVAAAVLLALAAGGYILRGVIFKPESPAGAVVVAVDQPGAEATLDRERTPTRSPAGGGEVAETPAAAPKIAPTQPATASSPTTELLGEREIAKWALAQGGKVWITTRGERAPKSLESWAALPAGEFTLSRIDLSFNAQLTDDDLRRLAGLKLSTLQLRATNITDAGLLNLTQIGSLGDLSIGQTKITTAGLAHLAQVRGLGSINLADGPLDDAGLAQLNHIKFLGNLYIPNTDTTDAGLKQLQDRSLKGLTIGGPQVTDASVEQLLRWKTLDLVGFRNATVTEAGLTKLAGLPNLNRLDLQGIALDDAAIERLRLRLRGCTVVVLPPAPGLPAAVVAAPAASPAPMDQGIERRAAEWALGIGGKLFVQVRGGAPIEIARVDQLPPPPFTVQAIEIRSNPRVNDQSLAVLDGLNHLERLLVFETAVSDRGMEHVRGLKSLLNLGVSVTGVTDAGVEQIADLPRLNIFFGNSTGIGDRGAQSLARSKNLSKVYLTKTQISDAGLAHLARLPLTGLLLEYTSVSDVGLRNLQACNTLTLLLLNGTRVTDAGLGFLAEMPRLEHLELRGDNITDHGVNGLAALTSLKNLAITETQITQAGYEKLQAALPGCKIKWSQRVAGDVAATTPTSVVPLDTSNRLPVPSTADQQKSLATLKDVFKDDFASAKKPDDKAALAEKLFKQAAGSRDDPAAAYVMLCEARNLAGDAADAALSVRLVSELGARFAVEPLELLADDLERATQKSHPSMAFKAIADVGLEHVDEALAADQFPLAKRLSDVALAAARKAKDSATLKTAIERNKSLAGLKQQWDAAQEARTTLAKAPDDPEANLALGRYLCFVRGDWAEGFAHLVRGSDATLKELATKSASDPQDAAGQAELGEAWAQAADEAKGKTKAELQAGARYWYAQALPALSGLAKAKAEQRLKQFEAGDVPTGRAVRRSRPTGSSPRGGGASLADAARAAQFILGLGGTVTVRLENGAEVKVASAPALPAGRFTITEVRLSENKRVGDGDLASLPGLTDLKTLYLNGTAVSDNGLANLQWLSTLEELNLSGLPQLTDQGALHLQKLTNLKILVLNSAHISDLGLAQLKSLVNLTNLSLVGTQVTGAGLAHLGGLKKLQSLLLANTPLGDTGLAEVRRFAALKTLDIGRTAVTDSGLATLRGLSNLASINLRETNTTDAGLRALEKLSSLQRVYVGKMATASGIEALRKALPRCRVEP